MAPRASATQLYPACMHMPHSHNRYLYETSYCRMPSSYSMVMSAFMLLGTAAAILGLHRRRGQACIPPCVD
eukprot:4925-Chlamydomonas_euryale.AAC.5